MTVSAEGAGERSLFVSYISEVPVWKATYRIVLDAKRSPLLQGWAIVDNTVGQDWESVEMSLVAGAPQSFVQELSKPYYSRRPVVPLPGERDGGAADARVHVGERAGESDGYGARSVGNRDDGSDGQGIRAAGTLVGETSTDAFGTYRLSGLAGGPSACGVQPDGVQEYRGARRFWHRGERRYGRMRGLRSAA